MGEESDGAAESTSKLREQIMALTNVDGSGGVDIMLNENEYRKIYDILKDIAAVWDQIEDVDAAALLELIAGKNRASIVAGLFTNFEESDKALQNALGSAGSALAENEKILDSIQGKLKQLEAAWESLSATVLSSELVKGLLDFAICFVQAIDKIISALGSLESAVSGAVMGMAAKKGIGGIFAAIAKGSGVAEAAMLGLKGGLVGLGVAVISVMGIKFGKWLWDIADTSINAQKNINDLSAEISSLENKDSDFTQLAQRFKELSDQTSLSAEETQEYIDVQNQLHDLLPSLKGYYDEHGNYIIEEIHSVEDAIAIWKEYIRLKKEDLTDEYVRDPLIGDSAYQNDLDEYSATKNRVDDIREYTKLHSQYTSDPSSLSETEMWRYYDLRDTFGDIDKANAELRELETTLASVTDTLQEHALTAVQATEGWNDLSEEEKSAIEQWIGDLDPATVQSIINTFAHGSDNLIDQITERALRSVNKIKEESNTTSSPSIEQITAGDIDISSYATHEKAVESLAEAYVEFLENGEVANQTLAELQETFGGCGEDWDAFLNRLASIDQLDTADYLSELNAELEKLQQGGNVDLLNRPQISTQMLKDVGWSDAGDGYATLYSGTYSNEDGTKAINFTPIFTNPETGRVDVLSPESLENYANGVLEGVHDDYLNLQIGAEFVGEDAIERAAEAGNYIHELHEILYADGDEQIAMLEGLYSKEDMVRGAAERLAESYLNEKIALGEVNENTRSHIESMLESIGVTNAAEVTEQALKNAKINTAAQIAQKIIAQSDENTSTEELIAKIREECAYLELEDSLINQVIQELEVSAIAKLAASDSSFMEMTAAEVEQLILEAKAANMAMTEIAKLQSVKHAKAVVEQYEAAEEAGQSSGIGRANYEAALAQLDKYNKEVDSWKSNLSEPIEIQIDLKDTDAYNKHMDDMAKKAEKTADKISDAFQEAYDELQFMREANLISEEQYLAQLFALNEKYNKNNLQMYRKYALEIFNTMKSLIADQINKQADAEIKALEEQREATEKYYDERIEALEKEREAKEKYYDELIEAEQDRLDQLKDEWTVQDHLLKIEQARAALKAAQEQKTVHLYKEGEGFVWEADQEEVGNANDALNEAIKDYERYMEEKEIQDRIDMLEDAKEQVLDMIDEQIEHLEEAKEQALEMIDEQIKAVEEWRDSALEALEDMEMSTEAFLEFFKQFGLEMTAEIDALIAKLDELAAAFARLAAARAAGYGDWEDDTSSGKKSGVTYTTSSKITGSETKGNVATKYDPSGKKYTISTTTSTVTTTTTGSDGSVKTSTHTNRYYDADDGATQISGR